MCIFHIIILSLAQDSLEAHFIPVYIRLRDGPLRSFNDWVGSWIQVTLQQSNHCTTLALTCLTSSSDQLWMWGVLQKKLKDQSPRELFPSRSSLNDVMLWEFHQNCDQKYSWGNGTFPILLVVWNSAQPNTWEAAPWSPICFLSWYHQCSYMQVYARCWCELDSPLKSMTIHWSTCSDFAGKQYSCKLMGASVSVSLQFCLHGCHTSKYTTARREQLHV